MPLPGDVWPATVSVPERGVEVEETEYVTEPFPLPLDPLVMLAKPTFDTAVHEQPVPAVTPIVPLPPAAGSDADVGEML